MPVTSDSSYRRPRDTYDYEILLHDLVFPSQRRDYRLSKSLDDSLFEFFVNLLYWLVFLWLPRRKSAMEYDWCTSIGEDVFMFMAATVAGVAASS